MTVAGLLLAAGEGRRFGGPKALVELGDELLVERGVRMLSTAGLAPVVVVLGAGAAQVARSAALGTARVVVNDGWSEGIGSSLRVGLGALAAPEDGNEPAEAVVVALADQPGVPPELVERLVRAWNGGPGAVVATFGGQPRNPVLLARPIWKDVAELAVGDIGARGYLRGHPERVTAVPCDDVGSSFDIDTPQDLTDLRGERPEGASWN